MKNLEAQERMELHYKLSTTGQRKVVAAAFRGGNRHSSPHKSHPVLLARHQWASEYKLSFNHSKSTEDTERKRIQAYRLGLGFKPNSKEKVKRMECRLRGLAKMQQRKGQYNFGFQDRGYPPSLIVLCNFLVKVTSRRVVDRLSRYLITSED